MSETQQAPTALDDVLSQIREFSRRDPDNWDAESKQEATDRTARLSTQLGWSAVGALFRAGIRDNLIDAAVDMNPGSVVSLPDFAADIWDEVATRILEQLIKQFAESVIREANNRPADVTDDMVKRASQVLFADYEQQYDGSSPAEFEDLARAALEAAVGGPRE